MATLIADGTAKAVCDWLSGSALSVKADNIAVASPGDGAVLIAGYDTVNLRQRYMETRGAVAAQTYASQRHLVDSIVRGDDGTTYTAIGAKAPNSIADETLSNYLLTRAAISGINTSGTANQQIRSVESRAALAAQAYTLNRLFVDAVVRGDDGATYSAIASRASASSQATSLVRVLSDSLLRTNEVNVGTYDTVYGMREISGTAGDAQAALAIRAESFWSSRQGRRYVCKSPNHTGVAAATSFVTTTPTFLIVAGSTKEVIIRRITVTLQAVGTSTTFIASVKTDTANRFSSGGTARAPGTLNQGNTIATGLAQNLETPTASAESTAIDVSVQSGSIVSGAKIEFLFLDGLIVAASGSLLLYVVTATSGATVNYEIEFEEANVQ